MRRFAALAVAVLAFYYLSSSKAPSEIPKIGKASPSGVKPKRRAAQAVKPVWQVPVASVDREPSAAAETSPDVDSEENDARAAAHYVVNIADDVAATAVGAHGSHLRDFQSEFEEPLNWSCRSSTTEEGSPGQRVLRRISGTTELTSLDDGRAITASKASGAGELDFDECDTQSAEGDTVRLNGRLSIGDLQGRVTAMPTISHFLGDSYYTYTLSGDLVISRGGVRRYCSVSVTRVVTTTFKLSAGARADISGEVEEYGHATICGHKVDLKSRGGFGSVSSDPDNESP